MFMLAPIVLKKFILELDHNRESSWDAQWRSLKHCTAEKARLDRMLFGDTLWGVGFYPSCVDPDLCKKSDYDGYEHAIIFAENLIIVLKNSLVCLDNIYLKKIYEIVTSPHFFWGQTGKILKIKQRFPKKKILEHSKKIEATRGTIH